MGPYGYIVNGMIYTLGIGFLITFIFAVVNEKRARK